MIKISCKREGSYGVEVTKTRMRKKIDRVVDDLIKHICPYNNKYKLKSVEIIVRGERIKK